MTVEGPKSFTCEGSALGKCRNLRLNPLAFFVDHFET